MQLRKLRSNFTLTFNFNTVIISVNSVDAGAEAGADADIIH